MCFWYNRGDCAIRGQTVPLNQSLEGVYNLGDPPLVLGHQVILGKDLWPLLQKRLLSSLDRVAMYAARPDHLRRTLVAGQQLCDHLEFELG
jgi:hypothetical protein